MFSVFESMAEHYELEKFVGDYDIANSIAGGVATGFLYKATAGPKTAILSAVIGETSLCVWMVIHVFQWVCDYIESWESNIYIFNTSSWDFTMNDLSQNGNQWL